MSSQLSLYKQKNAEIRNYMNQLNNIEDDLTNRQIYTKKKTERDNIQKIIDLVQRTRNHLANTMGSLNYYYTNNLKSSTETLDQQNDAVAIIDREMQLAKNRIAYINKQKENKMRVVEINQYYGSAYQERTLLLKWIIVFIVVMVVLYTMSSYLPNIPNYIQFIAVFASIGYFGYHILMILLSILARSRMIYDEYDWSFDKESAPEFDPNQLKIDPFKKPSYATCIAQACCSDGTEWDSEMGYCAPQVSTLTTKCSYADVKK